jgi:hypothetical protein
MSNLQFTQLDLLAIIGELELTRRAQAEKIEQLQEQLAANWSAKSEVQDGDSTNFQEQSDPSHRARALGAVDA